jgi:hypothetical protein
MSRHANVEVMADVLPFATRCVLGIAGVVAVLHCTATAFGSRYWFDEMYMLAIGRYHLDRSAADQPPSTPALAAFADAVAQDRSSR